ncbi:endo-1,3 1,4-beta-D-glucanase-like [Olea europaea subsp. europaea]|uniref:Endo-1,3 1,4-beta-D-glucanase-like n=1 Tax=Olea europaea subsp. europaea TaxID=158383 RepID=A0A8S0PHS5_OLEEU|nr:endo-1,3 1,4-beta-D-glucanase-like [Olea europaea subsp. europaea]
MSSPHSQSCEDPAVLGSSNGTWHVEELRGLKCYISGTVDSKLGAILVYDVFGYEAPNLKRMILYCRARCLNGEPYELENVERTFQIWIEERGPDQGFEDAKPIIEAMKSKGIEKIGAAGFCWGAKVVVELAKYAYIQAVVILHPSFVSLEDIYLIDNWIKVPISILGAEIDQRSPSKPLKEFDAALNAKPDDDAFVKVFLGVSHDWSVRYKDDNKASVESA